MASQEIFSGEGVGSIFKRDDIRGVVPDQLTPSMAGRVGRAFARLLEEKETAGNPPRVVVGHDARLSSPEISKALCRGLISVGAKVTDVGLCGTEQIYFAAGEYPERFDGGVMVTASHNPKQYNGFKMVKRAARPLGGAELTQLKDAMIAALDSGGDGQDASLDTVKKADLADAYAERILKLVDFDAAAGNIDGAAPLKVVVEAGNGVGGVGFRPIAKRLTAHTFVFSHEQPDGNFPHHMPNPLLPDYVEALGERVRSEGADLGVCFDGDGDRAGFVDESGEPLTASQVCTLVASRLLKQRGDSAERPVIMHNLSSSWVIEDVLGREYPNVELVTTPVGHAKIKSLMRLTRFEGRTVFAGEHSGHYFYPDFYNVDSGVATAVNMIALSGGLKAEGRKLSDLLGQWRKTYAVGTETNFRFDERAAAQAKLVELAQTYQSRPGAKRLGVYPNPDLGVDEVRVDPSPYDPAKLAAADLRLEFPNEGWWFVARLSGNEPLLRLNVEARGPDCKIACRAKLDELIDAVGRDRLEE